ncbi:MAG: carboxypeptidase regulatory-like domain-containing protein [Thermoguttaceae bacterium]|jgi:hypothetical protein
MLLAKRSLPGLFWTFLSSVALTTADEPKPPEPKRIDLEVRIIEPSGKPIAGAVVQVWKRHDLKQSNIPTRGDPIQIGDQEEVRTGIGGEANFSIILPVIPANFHMWKNSIHLTASSEKHLVCRGGPIDSAASDRWEATLILRRLMSIEGRVIDEQGRPVPEATVFHTGNASPRVEVKTDVQGHFQLDGLPEGKAPVFVIHPKFHFHGQLVDTSSAPQDFKLLGIDQIPPAMNTLPPLLSREEELKLARQLIVTLWEEAMKSTNEAKKEFLAECYVKLDPWHVYAEVEKQLDKANKIIFFWRNLPFLYPADPEEALAVLESLDTWNSTKTYALIRTVRESKGISGKQKLELLDRAIMYARTIPEPNERVEVLCPIALALFNLGKVDEAKKIVDELKPLALRLSPKEDAGECAKAGEAISLFDFSAGLRLVEGVSDNDCRMETLFDIAKRIAAGNPAEAERIVADAFDAQIAKSEKEYKDNNNREWPEDKKFSVLCYYETLIAPICYRMAAADPERAERIALKLQYPCQRAFCLGVIAEALAKTDKVKAKKLILQSYAILAEASANPRRYWWGWNSMPIIAAELLPIVEEIDPALVPQCMWQSVSFRLYRPVDDFIIDMTPENNDANLAILLARYNRALALAMCPAVDIIAVPPIHNYWSSSAILVFTNSEQILPSLGKDSSAHFYEVLNIVNTLVMEPSHRWDDLIISYK